MKTEQRFAADLARVLATIAGEGRPVIVATILNSRPSAPRPSRTPKGRRTSQPTSRKSR